MTRAAILAFVLVGGAMASAQAPVEGVDSQMVALDVELKTRPASGVTDIYKFLHQGQFGPGHAIEDSEASALHLSDEIASVDEGGGTKSLCQPLGGSPAMVRIHLRPFVAAGHDRAALLAAFVASADQAEGSSYAMDLVMEKAVARLTRRSRWDLAGHLEELRGRLAAESYPAVHHSDTYIVAYRPAYRVITLELAQQNGWCE